MPSRSLPATVLVVDDERPMLRLLRRQLQALGCTVLEATNGPEALLLLSRRGAVDLDTLRANLLKEGAPHVVAADEGTGAE